MASSSLPEAITALTTKTQQVLDTATGIALNAVTKADIADFSTRVNQASADAAAATQAAQEATSGLAGTAQSSVLAAGTGAAIGATRDISATGLSFGTSNLQILMRSSPIDVREALPGNFDATGATNYTVQIQKILDYLRDFGGGRLLLPSKTALLVGGLIAYSGTEVIAQDWTSELVVSPAGFGWGLSVNPLQGGTTNPDDNQRNIRLAGFCIRGQAAQPTFEEHQHLLNFNAVSDLLLEGLLVKGHRGDGIYIGSSNTNGVERHNERIQINRCTVDGVNADNRNGISIIDGTHVTIWKFKGINCTRPGQPGTIDVEPNANAFARVRHITVEDFEISGGNGSGVAFLLPSNDLMTVPAQNLIVRNGVIRGKETGFGQLTNVVAGATPHNTKWEDISVQDCATPFIIDSVRGAEINDVRCYRSPKQAQLGYVYGNFDIRSRGLRMYNCGTSETNALRIRTIDGLFLDDAQWVDSGLTAGGSGRAIYFANGTGANIAITNSSVTSPTGKTTTNIGLESGTYTLNQATCRESGNTFLVAAQQFVVNGTRGLSAPPATGTWVAGQQVFASSTVLAANGIEKWVVTTGGVDAAVKWEPVLFHPFRRKIRRNYQVVEAFDAGIYDIFALTIQANPALTYTAPTNGTQGQEITITVRNGSGGVMGAITWDAAFKMAGDWVNPANGKNRSISFYLDGTSWYQMAPVTGEVPN